MTRHIAETPAVYILHENEEWIPPLAAALDAAGVEHREWPLTGGSIDLSTEPPAGVFWSRLSASSHTRGHEHAKEQARAVLRWLESWGRRVVNGSRVVELEVSKAAQYAALRAAGFDVPHTVVVFGTGELKHRARELPLPFITKHNQGGKGLGVRRFDTLAEFDAYVDGPEFEHPVDGITLLQEYVVTAAPFVTRAEFVGGRFVYAVEVDTSAGSFELCPAEACAVPEPGAEAQPASLFRERGEVSAEHPLIVKLEAFLAEQGIDVAGVEFFETADGRTIPYDINTNTNYSPDVEAVTSRSAAAAVARFLGDELAAAAPQEVSA
ncbi:alpha-L-glutamate ligase [Herbiconiux sp. KACC 21604]|uniref:ATP-grasp domain-containing protein n=1 Tax=unclassified Herbiconiux TaxID=2618217 RepID=UPI0014929CED|nr:alpha-L-glutamate ligase [Herbiconiux sp. SALV-R1]QJU53127.1 alpha-L-glutamate ligase [Herbiconiux sp. SALV-R1]WPO88068.1 alpha-L-glutamate ligase [Herbiconiux sp. KACC 21604]